MICKRHCILTFRQLARTSTGPDTLFDASERPWANTAHNIAFDVDSFRATVHACIVRSFAAWSRRYAARMQRCTSELDLAMLPISYRLAVCAKRARQSRQTRRQRRLPLRDCDHHARSRYIHVEMLSRPPSVFAGGRWKTWFQHLDAARTTAATATQHHCCQPAAIVGCTPRTRQPRQHWTHSREREHDREDLTESEHDLRSGLAGP